MQEQNQTIRILFVEDLPSDVELAKREITKGGIVFSYRVVETEKDFRREIIEFDPDLIISDYSMPEFDGMSALMITQEFPRDIPFIVLTGSMNEETAVSCMKAGANDYVIKEQIKRLPFAVLEAIDKKKARQEKAEMQLQLRESEERLRLIFNNVKNIAVQGYNEKGVVHYWNRASEELYGYTAKEAIGRTLYELIIPETMVSTTKSAVQKMFDSEQALPSEEMTLRRKDGSMVTVYSNHVVVKVFGYQKELYCIDIDLTERKKMVEDLVTAKEKAEESDRLKSAFLMNMSHEIRTPMNGIIGFTDLLSKPQLTGEQKEQYIAIIRKSGERMLNTVNDIIEVSKIETGHVHVSKSMVELCREIEELCTFFKTEADEKGIQLFYDNTGRWEIVETDKTKFISILSNLIKNAIKYTDSGKINIGCDKNDQELIFYVKDTGIGIPKNRQTAIFNRFEQADIEDTRALQGSGLGLTIAKSYVEMLGGRIWVESEPDKGSQFYFTLPVHDYKKKPSNENLQTDNEMNRTNNMHLKVLIAEDEEAADLYLAIVLEDYTREILHAVNGYDTVTLCRNHPDIDIVLMDIKMPGLNGYEATRQIREFNKDVIIIAQTAYAIMGDREKAIAAGCDDYITKPINESELIKLIKNNLEQRRM